MLRVYTRNFTVEIREAIRRSAGLAVRCEHDAVPSKVHLGAYYPPQK